MDRSSMSQPGWVALPLAHNIAGTGNAWDEVAAYAVLMLLLVALVLYGYFTSKHPKK